MMRQKIETEAGSCVECGRLIENYEYNSTKSDKEIGDCYLCSLDKHHKRFKKFEVEVVTTNKYVIEFDTTKYTEQQMQDFRNTFFDFNTLEEHAENLAKQRVRLVSRGDDFIEGYGNVRIIKDGFDSKDYPRVRNGVPIPLLDGVTIEVVEEEESMEVEIN